MSKMPNNKKKIEIFIIPIKGIDVTMTYFNSTVMYEFNYEGKHYGNALNILPEGKKRPTIESSIKGGAVILLNAFESIEKLIKNK